MQSFLGMTLIFSLNGWKKTAARIPNIIKIVQQFQEKTFFFRRKKLSVKISLMRRLFNFFFSIKDKILLPVKHHKETLKITFSLL